MVMSSDLKLYGLTGERGLLAAVIGLAVKDVKKLPPEDDNHASAVEFFGDLTYFQWLDLLGLDKDLVPEK